MLIIAKISWPFFWTSAPFSGTVVYCKGGADMARMTVEEIYRGEKSNGCFL